MNSLAKIIKNAQALWPFYLGVIITSAIGAALALASPFIVREATDTIVQALNGDQVIRTALISVLGLAVVLLLADALNGVVGNIGGYIGDVMISRLRQILSTRYYAKLLSLPQGYYDNQVTGTIIARLDR